MKLLSLIFAIFATVTMSLAFFSPVYAMDDPGFSISRMVICQGVSDREPRGISDTFSVDAENVYSFLEAKDIEFDTTISFVWYCNR